MKALVLVIATCAAFLACDQPAEVAALGAEQSRAAKATQWLEFDLPADYASKDASDQFVVSGFRLGFFREGESVPLSTQDVMRDAVIVNGSVGRVALTGDAISRDVAGVVVRLQTLTRAGTSAWSDPTPVLGSTPRATDKAAGRGREPVAVAAVEQHPRLFAALRKALPPGVGPETVLTPFRTVNELATAVALCADTGIALETLSKAMTGPPRRSIRSVFQEAKPGVRWGRMQRQARAKGQALLEKAK